MRVCFRLVALVFASASLFFARADAATIVLKVTASPNPVTVSNSLTYTIAITNVSGVGLQNVVITNFLTQLVQFTTTNSTTTNVNFFVMGIGNLANQQSVVETLPVTPITGGTLTNLVIVANTNQILGFTNVLVSVAGQANVDLGVTMGGFPPNVFVNDAVTYQVSVTNGGPDSAPNVILSNGIPAGVELLGVSPTNQFTSSTNGFISLNLGTLTNGAVKNIFFTVQPTNSGVMTFNASVNAAGVLDTNSANNSVSSDITVEDFLGTLIATNASVMQTDPQTGNEFQTVNLSNIGSNSVPAARVIVSGLTNRLVNAVGTNNGNPFVVYGSTLDTNQSVNLILEYFTIKRAPFTVSNSQYTAVGIDSTNFFAPVGTNGTSTITRIVPLLNNVVLIEFTSTPGKVYTILYSDDDMTWFAAQPSITAQANRTQWLDEGPPKTFPVPGAMRFYRFYQNP